MTRYHREIPPIRETVLRIAASIVLCLPVARPEPAHHPVGFRQFEVARSGEGRRLEVAVWYPTASTGTPTLVGQNAIFTGQLMHANAPAAAGRHPLVVLSHGYGGNWTNQDWLAVELVRRGYVVAALNHPGTTTQDMDVGEGARLWERPQDVPRTIDAVTHDPHWSSAVSAGAVAAIGHSLGGWTVMELAGGRFDATRFEADCKDHAALASCQAYLKLGAGHDAASRKLLGQDLTDPRIKAVISLDLGLARGFDPDRLRRVEVPVLVIAAGATNSQIPAALESHVLAKALPASSTRYVELADAAHFSFLPVCRPGAADMLARDSPDDAVVCRDGEGADREAIHRQIAAEVIRFLTEALPPAR
jgi:predicted dienelactone hydrolase